MKCKNPAEGTIFLKIWQEEYLFYVQNYFIKKKFMALQSFFQKENSQGSINVFKALFKSQSTLYLYFVVANRTQNTNNSIYIKEKFS